MRPELDFLHLLADAAARETLPRFRRHGAVADKGGGRFDPVTEADRAAERAIRALIGERFSGHGIVGEEHGSEGEERECVWVIDPIDGTRAFISGLPVWTTLVGLYCRGRAVAGLIDQPFTGERYVCDGRTARYRGPDGERELRVRPCRSLGQATLFSTSPDQFGARTARRYRAVERRARLVRYGCDAYSFALLAAGHIDLVIESGLAIHDIAGPIAVLEGAGAIVTDWRGGRAEAGGDIVAAGSRAVHEEVLALLDG